MLAHLNQCCLSKLKYVGDSSGNEKLRLVIIRDIIKDADIVTWPRLGSNTSQSLRQSPELMSEYVALLSMIYSAQSVPSPPPDTRGRWFNLA